MSRVLEIMAMACAGACFAEFLDRAFGTIDAGGVRGHGARPIGAPLTAGLFAAAALLYRSRAAVVLLAPLLGVLVEAALLDVRARVIPNRLTYAAFGALGLAVAAEALTGDAISLSRAALGLLALGAGFGAVALAVPSAMGMGDAKLAGLIGLVLGAIGWSYVTTAVMAALVAGGGAAVACMATGADRRSTFAFGPCLAAGAVVAVLAAPFLAR